MNEERSRSERDDSRGERKGGEKGRIVEKWETLDEQAE